MKYIVVTGGVVSGLGKGITISSIGRVMQMCGLKTTSIKIDPYLNVDAGTMSPFEHGEVFVLDDGGEVDLDLGNYERFLDVKLSRDHNITTGKIYSSVINRERLGHYLGKTVQVVPHITDEIQDWIERVAHQPIDGSKQVADICLIEVGGTVGDIESSIFLEALRQFQFRVGPENLCLIHVSLVPILGSDKEQKTKPTQHGVKELRSLGLNPNFIVCRSSEMLLDSTKRKISIFCHVPENHVITIHDVSNIYYVPLLLLQQDIHQLIPHQLHIEVSVEPEYVAWERLASNFDDLTQEVRIAIVGKYTGLQDAYLSIVKALSHSSIAVGRKLVINWIEASDLEPANLEINKRSYDRAWEMLSNSNGVVIPGGFGIRGVEGKVLCAKYCRENRIPLLGVCLGMQVMVIEYARSILGWQNAHSAEFDETTDKKVVVFMPEIDPIKMGGTMRLGARVTKFFKLNNGENSLSSFLYRTTNQIVERHRHRYEVNPESINDLQQAGLNFVGKDINGERMEIVELPRSVHPFYIGCQYHPEFLSRPLRPAPLFLGLLLASTGQLDDFINNDGRL